MGLTVDYEKYRQRELLREAELRLGKRTAEELQQAILLERYLEKTLFQRERLRERYRKQLGRRYGS